jgi:hypothetical protein
MIAWKGRLTTAGFDRPMILFISCHQKFSERADIPEAKRSEPRRWAILVIHLGVSSIPCAKAWVKIGFFLPVCQSDNDLFISFEPRTDKR